MLKAFKRIDTQDTTLNKMQRNIENAFGPITKSNIVNGVLIKEINLFTGKDNVIFPNIGREVEGWVITRQRAESNIWDLQDTSSSSTKTLTLRCSADVTIDLWIF